MCDKKGVVESTLRALGLDHTRVPTTCNPGYRHTAPSDDEAAAKAHADRMRAPMSGDAPPQLATCQPPSLAVPQLPQSSHVPSQPACAASAPTRTGYARNDLVDRERIYKTPPTPADKRLQWYVWYLSEEMGTDLFQQHFQQVSPPNDDLIRSIADVEDKCPFGPDNGIVDRLTPEMTKNPLYQPPKIAARPLEPEFSPFWTSLACRDLPDYAIVHPRDGRVCGLVAEVPGRIWKYMTGHLTRLQSPISKSYFAEIKYVRAPAFWAGILNPHQLQHTLASVSDKTVNQDFASSDPRDFPSELNQTFDTSLLTPNEGIPDGNAAVINYVVRMLQVLLCESSMFKNNLMWDHKYQSWRLVFAMIPASKDTPPTFDNVTWKKDQYGKWKILNTPQYSAFFKDLRIRSANTETVHIQLRSSDFAHLPLNGEIKRLIEFPPSWLWFLSWSPGQVPEHFKIHH